MKKNKKKIIAAVLLALVLALSLFGCKKSENDNLAENKAAVEVQNQAEKEKEEAVNTPENQEKSFEDSQKEQTQNKPLTEKKADAENENKEQKKGETENKIAEEKPEEKNTPEQKQEGELFCTLSVNCSTAVKNISKLSPEKRAFVPENGVIFAEKKVVFYEGESVFNVLSREMKQNKIHMEFENTPVYKSAYIEGIANLYEFDCGELSGWMYSVNGEFPSYGCSRYKVKEGDRIEWIYTCDLGADIGGGNSAKNGR